jgi:hypothetical protein
MKQEGSSTTIIPAAPGWFVALYISESTDDDHLELEPIIAWEIDRSVNEYASGKGTFVFHEVMALTSMGNTETQGNIWAYKQPDGRFDIPHDRSFDTEKEAMQYMRKLDEEREAERKKRAQKP